MAQSTRDGETGHPIVDHEDRQVVAVPRWMMRACDGDPRDAMVLAQVAFWYQPPLDGSRAHRARLVVRRLDQDWVVMVDADLAEQLGMSRPQVQRARAALAKRGLIETKTAKVDGERRTLVRPVIAGKRESAHRPDETLDPRAETRDGSTREDARIRGRASCPDRDQHEDQEPPAADAAGVVVDLFGDPAAQPPPRDETKDRAHAVTTRVFEEKHPRPAHLFVAVLAIARRLLEAGHADDDVVAAMVAAPTITVAAVELQLGTQRGSGRAAFRPDAGIITDRTGTSGPIDL